MSEISIVEAVKELRSALGVSQVTFSVRLGKSLTMVQRYEGGDNIPARDLAIMVGFARGAGRADLARKFKADASLTVKSTVSGIQSNAVWLPVINSCAIF
jgi:transcriptional regulator with XRE-family HTH domain